MNRAMAMALLDVRSIVRDPMQLFLTVLPLLLLPGLRFGIPELAALLRPWVEVSPYFPLLVAFFGLITPSLVGWVTGFMLLDDRDEGVLAAVAVTPTGKGGFLFLRIALLTVAAFVLGYVLLSLNGLLALPPGRLALAAALASLEAPMMALLLAAFASNKVEGVAVAKGLNILYLGPFLLVFGGPWWQYPAMLLPPYWVGKLMLEPELGPWGVAGATAAGLAVHGAYLAFGLRRFLARVE